MTQLTAEGIETTPKQAEPINQESEDILWEKKSLGNKSSKSVLNTMIFYNSKLFGLRGVDEHRNLSTNQFKIGKDQNYIAFSGRASKTYKAGVPEQEIMNRTGHRSVESVRKYKRASTEMLMDISNILEPGGPPKKCKLEPQDKEESMKMGKSGLDSINSGNADGKMCVFAGV
ncbi:unnamed protein product [Mytilus coruscus]|uniref:ZMYM2-like/QRICH1 C-terminal domain-containing protein n=1 Tax=Mytilus coruscus TaxID=42192 RepID=A0A6J8ADP9_MYTCO|nr:unnamed protein product [Mytilus coruscus]